MNEPRSDRSDQGPSLFFIIALALGLIMIGWLFIRSLRNAPRQTEPLDHSTPTSTTSRLWLVPGAIPHMRG